MEKVDFFSRLNPLLSSDDGEKIVGTKLLIVGCGVGSQIAVSAARMGFSNFVLIDGDTVEPHNLNRQAYTQDNIGDNKAVSLKKQILKVNPLANVDAFDKFLSPDEAGSYVGECDIVVDTIDPMQSPEAVFALHSAAKNSNKHVIFPVDIGWGARVFVFGPGGDSLEDMMPGTKEEMAGEYMELAPDYFKKVLQENFAQGSDHIPQPITSTALAASMSVVLLVKLALGEGVPLAPKSLSYDPHVQVENEVS